MIIATEGCDKSGKTTIHDQLANTFKKSKIPFVRFKAQLKPTCKEDSFVAYLQYRTIFDLAEQNPKMLILMDRSYISEMVYSGVKRDYDAIDDISYGDFMRRKDVLLVYVSADDDVLAERFKTEKEEYIKPEEIDKILTRYETVLREVDHKILRIKTPSDRTKNINEIIKTLHECR